MTSLVDGVVKLIKAEFGYDLLDALMGFENAEKIITNLMAHSSAVLVGKIDKQLNCCLIRSAGIYCAFKR